MKLTQNEKRSKAIGTIIILGILVLVFLFLLNTYYSSIVDIKAIASSAYGAIFGLAAGVMFDIAYSNIKKMM